ncbi:DUF5703 family protein [Demequina lutea]|uniref:Uncharacterized protein n=1 Tax=Demequina lutea TaxID=431489 RepID=A0A7Y9ZA41_9MICO|nr:DUF5703 family protein [Demequina lutea]NYI41584.1 hypothetical protein [Demequina lutea]
MTDSVRIAAGHVINPRMERAEARSHTQWRVVDVPRSITRAETTQILAEQAEYGRWELARSLVYVGGARRVWLRRRAMRVERTDAA